MMFRESGCGKSECLSVLPAFSAEWLAAVVGGRESSRALLDPDVGRADVWPCSDLRVAHYGSQKAGPLPAENTRMGPKDGWHVKRT
jgi:hypothetical protein